MKKEQALARVTALECDVNSTQKELKKLRKIIETPEGIQKAEDIYSTEDACYFLGKQMIVRRDGETDDEYAYRELKLIIEAFRKGRGENGKDWIPNYKDKIQRKYFGVFDTVSGFSFRSAYYGDDYSGAYTGVGGRFVLPTSELVEFVAIRFLKKYEVLLIPTT